MNILVIGGTRFIGIYVVRQLIDNGHSVTVYHRGKYESKLAAGVRHVLRTDESMLVRNFSAELLTPSPDVVIHMIAMGEVDAQAAVEFFRDNTGRMVWISSGDVYLAYGRFTGTEPGAVLPGLLTENSPLRTLLYPYRDAAKPADDIANTYDKVLVERIAASERELPATILRLPKVYGRESNSDLATVYAFRNYPRWRWTHGYVGNVAAAIVLAAVHPAAAGRSYNVGEEHTPTIGERLAKLPPSEVPVNADPKFNFDQDIVYDTTRIREELGYRDIVPEDRAMKDVVSAAG
jgi:nucleoside-diphosphate-sugar epimerase